MASAITILPSEIAEAMNTDVQGVIMYAKRKDDPLPLLAIRGRYSRGFAFRDDFEQWLRRNTVPYAERKAYKHEPMRMGR